MVHVHYMWPWRMGVAKPEYLQMDIDELAAENGTRIWAISMQMQWHPLHMDEFYGFGHRALGEIWYSPINTYIFYSIIFKKR